ncbi:MAG: hypothetical protein RL217_1033 [Pseudomonadota bacterium]
MHNPLHTLSIVSFTLALGACSGSTTSPEEIQQQQRIESAISSGNPSALQPEDAASLLQQAISEAGRLQNLQQANIKNIYIDGISPELDFTTNSLSIFPRQATVAFPYLVANNGNVLASISLQGKGRGLAYGRDMLEHLNTGNVAHKPLFNRTFNWIVLGDANQKVTKLKYAITGYDNNRFNQYLTSRNIQSEKIMCDLNDSNNSCWQQADLLVFGSGAAASTSREKQIKQYQEAGKPILYLHASWANSNGGRQVVHGLGMEMGDYPGNYFQSADGIKIRADRPLADTLKRSDQFGDLYKTLNMLADPQLVHNFSEDITPTNTITKYMNELGSIQSASIKLFSSDYTQIYRLLVLWADLYRTQLVYKQPEILVTGNANKFLSAYASDSFLYSARKHTKTNPEGAGDYMPKAAQFMQVNGSEIIEVTIAQGSGATAIGLGAIPGGAVQIEIVDAAGLSYLGVQTSHIRTYGNPLQKTDAGNYEYDRPRRPHSFTVPLNATEATDFITPFGGPLFLRYEGGAQGKVVKLKITGAVNYSHFDFTKTMSDEEMAYAISALEQGEFGWQTLKFVGGEIQQTLYYARSAMGKRDPKDYVVNDLQNQLFKSNHMAMGFNNEKMAASGVVTCAALDWDCTSAVHNAPSVQHFIGWLAACGFLCSGNPSDGASGLAVGWGWAHELGHNTVQRIFNILSCQVECDNNVLAAATMLRLYDTKKGTTKPNLDYPDLYKRLGNSLATGKTGVPLQEEMRKDLWDSGVDQNSMRPVFFELSFLYSKHRLGMNKPNITSTLEFLALLNIGTRLVDRTLGNTPTEAMLDKYAMRGFAKGGAEGISNTDLLYVLSSKIIGKNMRDVFYMYGLPISDKALAAVSAVTSKQASMEFYAVPLNGNDIENGQWLTVSVASRPAWPFSN